MEQFKDLQYRRPDIAPLKREAARCIRALARAASFAQADAAFLRFHDVLLPAVTQKTIAEIRQTINTKDPFYDTEVQFYNKALPMLTPLLKKALGTLLGSPYRAQFAEKYGEQLFRTLETLRRTMSTKIILPAISENRLCTQYSKTAAACGVEFMGEKCNFYGLLRHMESTDRAERKAAFEAWAKLYEEAAPALEKQYAKLVKLRRGMAKKLGCANYIEYIYAARDRYDYNAGDAAAFREAVRKYITPLCAELYAAQRRRLGVEKLCFYDERLTGPAGNAVPEGTPDELVEKARRMYDALSPETGEFFAFLQEHALFDLVTRENKHLGGYCTALPEYKAPFIFSNFNGTSADVDVLTHEAGHAFEFYYASRRLPLPELASSTSEINEIHSMSMELFAYPYMELFFGDKADAYRCAHFEDAVKTIPYLVAVDEFQHRVFETPGSGPADWRRFWRETEQKYMPWRDYDGNAFLESGGFWMQKQHIFLYPFYYIDYALAQLGAFALYRRELTSGDGWTQYLKLCADGGRYGYFETVERAGIPIPLREETVRDAAVFMREQAEALRQKAAL